MLTQLQKTILSALSAFLKGEKYLPPKDTDWKSLYKESVAQAVALGCLQGLDISEMPSDVKKVWQNFAVRSLKFNASIHQQHGYVHSMMSKEKISYAILKGSSSAYYYKDSLMRVMGDVDFWVCNKDLQKSVDVLVEDGFVQKDMKHPTHWVFKKDKIHLELHLKPAGLPEGKYGEILTNYLSNIFESGEEVEIAGNTFYKPNNFHHGLIVLMHTYHHMLSEGIGLRHLCDWAVFVDSFEDEDFASIFKEKLSKVGLWKFAQVLSQTAHLYLGIKYKKWMGEIDYSLCENVIVDIFVGGNFGGKDKNRTLQGLSISDRGKSGVKKTKLGQFVSSSNAIGTLQFPKLAKIPVLKHFCFVPLGVRHCFRVLTGKRKSKKLIENIKVGGQRKKIYEQFKLFEVEEK